MTRIASRLRCKLIHVVHCWSCLYHYHTKNFRCENGKCVPRCQTEHDCQDKTHFCRDGHCTNSCQTRADCPDKAQNHKICKDSQCYYIPIGCRSDDECEAPMKCVKSKCITTHCSTDEECNNLGKEGNFRCIRGNCIQSAECTGNRQCRIRHGFDHYCIKSQCRKVSFPTMYSILLSIH